MRSRTVVIIALAAVIALVVGGAVVYLVVFSSVNVKGTVTVGAAGAGYGGADGSECHGAGAYADVTTGATVEISDGAGKVIGLGKLGPGKTINVSQCQFTFAVNAPREDIYGIQVSHRGVLRYSRAQAQAGVEMAIAF